MYIRVARDLNNVSDSADIGGLHNQEGLRSACAVLSHGGIEVFPVKSVDSAHSMGTRQCINGNSRRPPPNSAISSLELGPIRMVVPSRRTTSGIVDDARSESNYPSYTSRHCCSKRDSETRSHRGLLQFQGRHQKHLATCAANTVFQNR